MFHLPDTSSIQDLLFGLAIGLATIVLTMAVASKTFPQTIKLLWPVLLGFLSVFILDTVMDSTATLIFILSICGIWAIIDWLRDRAKKKQAKSDQNNLP